MRLEIESISKILENFLKEKIKKKDASIEIELVNYDGIYDVFTIYKHSFMAYKIPLETIAIEYLKELYNIPEISIYLVKIYGVPAGFMILDFDGYNNEYGFITALGVIPRFQGKGIGLTLDLRAWNHFKERNVKELRCEVYYRNENSIGFLKALNFQEFAIR